MSGQNRSGRSGDARRGLPVSPKMIGAAVVVVLLVLFIVLNRDTAQVSFILFTADVALWVALTVAAAAGLAVGFVLGRRRRRR